MYMLDPYLVRAFAIDGHDETDSAGLVLVLGIVESLLSRCLPWHLLLLLLLNILILLSVQMQFIRFFEVIAAATNGRTIEIIGITDGNRWCCCCLNSCTFKFAIVSDCWCHYTLLPLHLLKISRDLIWFHLILIGSALRSISVFTPFKLTVISGWISTVSSVYICLQKKK